MKDLSCAAFVARVSLVEKSEGSMKHTTLMIGHMNAEMMDVTRLLKLPMTGMPMKRRSMAKVWRESSSVIFAIKSWLMGKILLVGIWQIFVMSCFHYFSGMH